MFARYVRNASPRRRRYNSTCDDILMRVSFTPICVVQNIHSAQSHTCVTFLVAAKHFPSQAVCESISERTLESVHSSAQSLDVIARSQRALIWQST